MKILATLLLLFPPCASAFDLVTARTVPEELQAEDVISISEASHRDLLSELYTHLRTIAERNAIATLPPPRLGYEVKIAGATCRYRFVPTKGTDQHQRIIAGYFFELDATGGLPLSALLYPDKQVDELFHECFSAYTKVSTDLREKHGVTHINNVIPLDESGTLHWRVEPPIPLSVLGPADRSNTQPEPTP